MIFVCIMLYVPFGYCCEYIDQSRLHELSNKNIPLRLRSVLQGVHNMGCLRCTDKPTDRYSKTIYLNNMAHPSFLLHIYMLIVLFTVYYPIRVYHSCYTPIPYVYKSRKLCCRLCFGVVNIFYCIILYLLLMMI